MRIAMTLIIFAMASVTIAGLGLAVLLSAPIPEQEVWNLFAYVAAGGFAVALIASYFVAGKVLASGAMGAGK